MDSQQSESSHNNVSKPLELFRIFMALLCPMVVVGFSIHLRLQLERKLIISIVRSIVQLLLAGFVLLSFIFSINNFVGVIFYIFLMSLIAALETVSRQKRTYKGHYIDSLISILVGGAMVGTYGTIIVFNPDPWWDSSVMIPTAGMIIGSAVSGPSLAVERLLSEICEKRHETETRLCFGANRLEAVLPIMRSALLAALTPNLNQMAVVGLVSIPGMMTGQLLAGATPLVATQYQMCILWLINGSAAISTYIALHLTILHAVFDKKCRISAQKIITQEKKSIDVAIIKGITNCIKKIRSYISQFGRQTYQKSVMDLESKESDARDKDLELSDQHQIIKRQKCRYQFEERSKIYESDEIIFQVRNLNVMSGSFPLFERSQGLNFEIKKGERIILQGPSGLGKTRILRALSQLDEPYQGEMQFMNVVNSEMPNWRAHIIYVPQSLPPMDGSPKDLLKESLKYKSRSICSSQIEIESQCNKMFSAVGLDVSKSDQAWLKLSGGERQRSVIAISIILAQSMNEAILLLDEPTAACDAASQIKVEQALTQSGISIIMITHDENQAKLFGHRTIKFSQYE